MSAMNRVFGLRTAAVVLLAAAVTAACDSSGTTDTGTSASATPVSGGNLTIGTSRALNCLDPQVSATSAAGIIDRAIFDSLVSAAPDGTFKPWLAQRWTVSPDGLTYTFDLRPGVTFQDGTPLTAAAVKATLDHAVDPATKSEYAAGLLGPYAGSTAVGTSTVKVRLKKPYGALLQALSTPYLGIQSLTSLTGDTKALCDKPVGSGPFSLAGWSKTTSVVLKRNAGYRWGPPTAEHTGPAYLETVTYKFLTEDAVRVGALTSGQLDVVTEVPPARVKTLKSAGSYHLLQAQVPGVVDSLFFNVNRAPLNDEKVRSALLKSVDIGKLVTSVGSGQYSRAWSLLSPATPDYSGTENSVTYDPAAAGALLDQAGWTGRDADGYRTRGGTRLTLQMPVAKRLVSTMDDTIFQGIQAEAKKAGFDIEYKTVDVGTYVSDVLGAKLDLLSDGFRRSSPDILRYLFASDQTPEHGGGNTMHYHEPQLDGWLDDAAAATDPAARTKDYQQAQQYLIEHALALPLYVGEEIVATSSKVHGLTLENQASLAFYDAWTDTK